jgi:hypothetical protein
LSRHLAAERKRSDPRFRPATGRSSAASAGGWSSRPSSAAIAESVLGGRGFSSSGGGCPISLSMLWRSAARLSPRSSMSSAAPSTGAAPTLRGLPCRFRGLGCTEALHTAEASRGMSGPPIMHALSRAPGPSRSAAVTCRARRHAKSIASSLGRQLLLQSRRLSLFVSFHSVPLLSSVSSVSLVITAFCARCAYIPISGDGSRDRDSYAADIRLRCTARDLLRPDHPGPLSG